jgi:GTPase SAR1 family protein
LGLYDPESKDEGSPQPENGMIEVPVWRHAIINFPHPLLKQGLVILDTPGLNALGSEPELTLSMLPGAHAILFLLAADTGVTKTDMDVWQNHVRSVINAKGKNCIVVLNKIDSLWDDLYDEEKILKTIKSQVEETAHILKVDPSSIFPVSAQKGLLGKVKNDSALLNRSGLPLLEARLADSLVPAKHEIIRNRIIYEISGRVESSRAVLNSKLATINKQLSELKRLGVKNLDAIQKMVSRMRKEKEKYDKELKGFKMTHTALSQQAKTLLGYLSMGSLDEVIRKTRNDMKESWTTRGLKSGMTTFFSGSLARMELVSKKADEIKNVVDGIYTKLHTEYGLAKIMPAKLSLLHYLMEFKKLEQKAEAFRKSPATLMTEQHFIIKKFFITLVSQARHIFQECNNSSKSWFQAIVNPVFVQIREHKALIDRNLDALKKIHENMDHLGDRIAELESTKTNLEEQLMTINGLLERIHQPIS